MPLGESAALAAALCWALGSLLFLRIGRATSPSAMNVGKCISAALLLVFAQLLLGHSPLPHASTTSWLLLAASAIVGLTIGDTAYFSALVSIGVPRSILLLSTSPLFAGVLGFAFYGERIGLRGLLGMTLTLTGIALVVARRDVAAMPIDPRVLRRGVMFGLIAGLCQALGSLLSKQAMQQGIDPIASASGRLLIGSAGLIAVGLVRGQTRRWIGELGKDSAWLRLSGAAVVGTFFGISLAQIGIAHARSTAIATTLLATSPIFALPLAHLSGTERMTLRGVLGSITAVGGIAILTLR